MKSFTNRLTNLSMPLLFPAYLLWKKARKGTIAVVLLAIITLSSCFQHYFRTHTQQTVDAATIKKLQYSSKYFIIHYSNQKVSGLYNVSVSGDSIMGDPVELRLEHAKYINPTTTGTNRVRKADKPAVLMEVHLYFPQQMPEGQTHVSLHLSAVNRIDVYEFDRNATTGNHIISWIGVGVATYFTVGLIAFAIACNCPQVDVNANGQYEFKGGIYSGAVYSSLERQDYLPLEGIQPINDKYQFRIRNVANEKQFINQVQLLRVEHPADVKVLADRHGKILSYKETALPVKAMYDSTDITHELKFPDEMYYSFDSRANENGLSSVIVSFDRPFHAGKAKLLVQAGNSKWSGYLYREFASMFGSSYNKWRRQQEEAPSNNAEKWQIDQGLPLKVFAETDTGWQYVDHFALTGNTASRNMIMEIDLSHVKTDKVNIRLESTFQFWNLDKVAMDFSDDEQLNASLLDPASVTKNEGTVHRNEILKKDKTYLHLTGNEFVNIEFNASVPSNGTAVTLFFAGSGYYHSLYKSENKPDIQSLMKFKENGAFDRFSRAKYAMIMDAFTKNAAVQPATK